MAASGLGRLLAPTSIAIVGASDKVGPGFNAWRALEAVGYRGRIHLVNPNRPSLFGHATYPSLSAIPDSLDAVFIAVPRDAVVTAIQDAAAKGAGGVAVLSSGFGEAGPDGVQAEAELQAVARDHDIAVCGPNCLGFLNLAGSSALWGTSLPAELPRGTAAAVVQSGSVGIALLNAARGLGFAYLITSGNEAVTTTADYLDVLVDDPGVTVIVAFLEQLRKPRAFVTAARRAAALGKPLIVVKSGRTERGRQAVMAHTGAVAGHDEVVEAAFRAAGVIRARTLDEMMEFAVLASTTTRRPTARGVAILSPSGGEIALALDLAEPSGLELPAVPNAARDIAALLPDYAHAGNPLDLTWAGLYDPAIARRCVELLGGEAEVGSFVLLHDAPRGLGDQQATRYASLLRAVVDGAEAVGKPLAIVSNLAVESHLFARLIDTRRPLAARSAESSRSSPPRTCRTYDAVARERRVPVLRGTEEGLSAVARYARWATTAPDALPTAPPSGRSDRTRSALSRLPAGRSPAEHEVRALLSPYGIRGPRETIVTTAHDAAEAARTLGYPIALKAVVVDVMHKTEHGLVRLGVGSDSELRQAVDLLTQRAAAIGRCLGILVQEMAAPVAELIVGARTDPDFGPIIIVGGGGITVEVYRDVAIRLAPVRVDGAREMLAETRASALLQGWRGRPPGDIDAVATVVAALSEFIADTADLVAEIEINPLGVLAEGHGALALDALIVRAPRA